MKPYQDITQIVNNFHKLGQTVIEAKFLLDEYNLSHYNIAGFELREIAKPDGADLQKKLNVVLMQG